MSFKAPENIHFEEPLRSPHLSEDADRELDKLVDGGVEVAGEAWKKVTKKYGTTDWLGEATVQKLRDLSKEDDVPTAAPPKPGESDEQIRQRHRDALRARETDNPPDQSE
jgi:hypothetical protein